MSNWFTVPDNWELISEKLLKQKNVQYFILGGTVETRKLPDGTTEWRRKR